MTSNSSNQIPEEWLSAYLDDELTDQQRQLVEVACSQNPQLAQLLEELRATRQLVSHLPLFPSSVARRASSNRASSWQDELDDGLGANDDRAGHRHEDPNSLLATSSDQQLNRALDDDGSEATSAHSSNFQRKRSSTPLLRWAVLAASLLGLAFLASMIWPGNLGVLVGQKDSTSVSGAPARSGSMVSGGETEDAIQSETIKNLAESQPSGEILAPEALRDSSAMEGSPSIASSSPAAEFGQSLDIVIESAAPSSDSLAKNALAAGLGAGEMLRAPQLQNSKVELNAADGMGGFGARNRNDDPFPKDSIAVAPQAAQADLPAGTPANMESPVLPEREQPRRFPAEKLPPPSSSLSIAPVESKEVKTVVSATWHRSDAWTDESARIQFESNMLLKPMRPLLKNSVKASQESAATPNSAQAVPLAILSADEQFRKNLADKLASINLSPPLSPVQPGTSWVLFLNKEECDRLLGGMTAVKSRETGPLTSPQLFWVTSGISTDATQNRVLIVNEQ